MTAEDLLLAAGGFTEKADPFTAQLVRRLQGLRDDGDVILSVATILVAIKAP